MKKPVKAPKLKTATCVVKVPAVLNGGKKFIAVGDEMDYVEVKFFNGEHHLVRADGTSVPEIFFEV